MNQSAPFRRILFIALLIGLLAALPARPALAVPPLPADFWGYITINGSPAPAGTAVTATVNGVTFPTTTFMDGGQALYLLSVNGDDTTTPATEGGSDGQTISFKVDGAAVSQTAVWRAGTSTRLDLARTTTTTPATVVSISPTHNKQGATINVTVVGKDTNFQAGVTQLSMGDGITVNSVTVNSRTQLTANISIHPNAQPGKRTVTVTTGGEIASKNELFSVFTVALEVYLPADSGGPVGSLVSIPVVIPVNNSGRLILGYSLRVTADPAVLQFEGADSADTLSSGWSVQERHDTPGEISVVAFGTTYLGDNGVLVNLLGRVTGSNGASTPLQFAAFTWNEGLPTAAPQDGRFTSAGLGIVGKVTYGAGGLPVPGVLLTLSGGAAMTTTSAADGVYRLAAAAGKNYTVTPSSPRYSGAAISALDAARVAQCVLGLRPAADCPTATANVSNSGGVSVYDASLIARYAVGLTSPTSQTGNWVYEPATRSYTNLQASQLDQDYAASIRGDVTASWGQAAVVAGNGAVGAVRLVAPAESEGEQMIAPLRLTAPVPADLVAYQFDLSYDPALLQFAGADAAGTLSEGWEVVWNEDVPGHVMVAAFAAQPLAGEGDLLRLVFSVTGASDPTAALAAVQVSPISANEGAVVLEVTPDLGALLNQTLYLPAVMSGE